MDDDRNKYEFNATGVLQNPQWESKVIGATPAQLSQFLQYTTYTSFTVAGSVRTNDSKRIDPVNIIRQKFTYTGLPASNGSFGDKEVLMQCTQPISTTQKAYVRVFFMKTANNHPVSPDAPNFNSSPTPNWFYYWHQTPAYYGQVKYSNAGGVGQTGRTFFDPLPGSNTWVSVVYDGSAGKPTTANSWNGAKGIDLFANLCRHEERHRLDMVDFWGANSDRIPGQDGDGDSIPTNYSGYVETNLTPTAHQPSSEDYQPDDPDSVADDVAYGTVGWGDLEDYAMHRQEPWTNGFANSVDWAHPGKQWWLNGNDY
ncbi:MAG: hypothetical protein WAO58_10515 [Fimbriimonadaceae bacterium]